MKFRVYWSNFGYFSQEEFTSLDAARKYGVAKFFEHSIYEGDTPVGYWTTFGGWHSYA